MARYQFERSVNIASVEYVKAFIDAARANEASKSNVVKIVIGPAPGILTEEWDSQELARLSDVEWNSFPNLTHLYLWSIAGLKRIGPLPANLECLDLRRCRDLETLPADLPPALETLDLEGCAKLTALPDRLPTSLVEIYLQDCAKLESFAPVRALLERMLDLEAAPTTTADEETDYPHGLRRLELHGCNFDDHDATLHGERGENVAASNLRHLRRLRQEGAAPLAECKIVVLGDGGAGKTSLIRALKGLPFREEDATDRIRCWDLDDWGFRPFPDAHPDLPATINVWDFAGQQLYHSTHRMFLESRAVFVVVWRTPPRDGGPNRPSHPDDQRHDLNYWLDQIHAANDRPFVILVRSRKDEDTVNPPDPHWPSSLRDHYRHLAQPGRFFEVSATDDGRDATLPGLRSALQKGITGQLKSLEANVVPRGWKAVREKLATRQPRWQDADDDQRRHGNDHPPVMKLHAFETFTQEAYRDAEPSQQPPDRQGVVDLLHYLHDIGALYCPRAWRGAWQAIPQPQVIVDQQWAIEAVYRLTTSPATRACLEEKGGKVTQRQLDALWQLADGDGPVTSQPDDLWAVEQMMLSAGVLVEVPMRAAGQRQFVFPDHLPGEDQTVAALRRIGTDELGQRLGQTHEAFRVIARDGKTASREFDYPFASRLIARILKASTRAVAFRFGAIIPIEWGHGDSWPQRAAPIPSIALVVAWQPHGETPGSLTFSVYGDATPGDDVGEMGWRCLEPWLNDVGAGLIDRPRLTYQGRKPAVAADGQERLRDDFFPRDDPRPTRVSIAVSYANKSDARHAAFPVMLVESIKRELSTTGIPTEDVTIVHYDDTKGRSATEIITEVWGADVFVGILSHKYMASAYCLQELYLAALRSDESDTALACRTITRENNEALFPDSTPRWRERMRLVRLPADGASELSDFDCLATENGEIARTSTGVIDKPGALYATAVWAAHRYGEAEVIYKLKQVDSPMAGSDVLYSTMSSEPAGKWLVVAHKIGKQGVSRVRHCVTHENVAAWDRLGPTATMQDKADALAKEIIAMVEGIRRRETIGFRERYFITEAIKSYESGKLQEAIASFDRLRVLRGFDPDTVAATQAQDLFGESKLEQVRQNWLAERRTTLAGAASTSTPPRPDRR